MKKKCKTCNGTGVVSRATASLERRGTHDVESWISAGVDVVCPDCGGSGYVE